MFNQPKLIMFIKAKVFSQIWVFLALLIFLPCSGVFAGEGFAEAKPKSSLQIVVHGNVVSEVDGLPLPGVTVRVQGTSNGVVADFDGEYEIEISNSDAILEFSYIGFSTQKIPVNGRSEINISLEEDAAALDEIVVIGYGTVRRSDVTGAVSSVSSEEINQIATASVGQALQGRAAGVTVVQESGAPNSSASIKIRGVGTTNNTSPLFVVDGFPVTDINYLSPNDIKSLEILKDASATAIYGSRGANGVVLITTKKGTKGALKIDVSAYYGIEQMGREPEMLDSREYALLSNEAYINAGEEPIYSNTDNLPYNTNWFEEVSRIGTIQNHNISFSGGGEKLSSRLSANYFKREGIIKSTDFDRMTFLQNNTLEVTDFLELETSLSAVFSNFSTLDPTSLFLSSLIAPPDIPVIDPETDYYTGVNKIRLVNPLGRIARNNDDNSKDYIIGNVSANISITEDLSFVSRFGVQYQKGYNSGFSPIFYETPGNSSTFNTVSRGASKMIDMTWENILTYHVYNEIHDFSIMGAISSRDYKYDGFSATKQNVPLEGEEFWYFDAATENPQANGSGSSLTMLSYLGRINYSYRHRYLLTGSVRRDGSSRFLDPNKWGTFPSGAFAWKISEENFLQGDNMEWLSSAKVRIGYGEIGNENIDSYYPFLTPISQQQYYTLGSNQARVNGSGPTTLGNPEVKWETSTQSNIGIDLSLLMGKLSATADYYIRRTDDILLSQQVPAASGSNSVIRNVGGIENKGFEFSINYRDNRNPFSYDINANFATVKNEVTSLGSTAALISSFDYDYVLIDFQGALGSMIRSEVGKPYGQFYGFQTDGIFQNQQEVDQYVLNGEKIQPDAQSGDFRFKDNNNDGRIDDADRTFIGNSIPKITFGMSFNADYKNFDLSLLLQGQGGNDIYNAAKYYFMRFDGTHNVRTELLGNYWTGENSSNDQPAITSNGTRNDRNYRNSDYYVEDGSYVRLKNLQLGYTFRPNLSEDAQSTVRVYLAAQNLLTFSSYSGFEPEISGNSIDRGIYPQTQTFMLGTNINF
jgi:TonB-linked SusC/RagA family outer membrane protein